MITDIKKFKKNVNEQNTNYMSTARAIKKAKLNEEKISEEEQLNHLKLIQDALPELEKMINGHLKTNINFGLTAELKQSVRSGHIIEISGVDVAETLKGTIASAIFSEINIYFWGGVISDKNKYWFNPKVSYSHPSGGSNGADLIWTNLWFDLDTRHWIEGNVVL